MSPSLSQMKPARVIAEFGKKNNPLFLVEEGHLPGRENEADDRETFLVRDSDQALPSSTRLIGGGALKNIDEVAGTADLEFEVDRPGEAAYTLSPGDIVSAIGALTKDRRLKEVRLAGVNLPHQVVERIIGPQELISANPETEPYEFRIAA